MNPEIETLKTASELKTAGKFPEAEALLINLLQEHPSFAPAYNSLGSLYFNQQQWKDAEKMFRKAIEHQANYTEAYYNLGLTLMRLYRDREALTVFQALLELSPHHFGAQFQLGSLFMRQQQFQKAQQLFSQLIQSHSSHLESRINLAACCLQLNQLAEARAHYLKALELSPEDIQSLYNLGVINLYQGLTEEAIEYYLRVIQRDPKNVETHNNLGVAYLAKNNREKALFHFREALLIQPENTVLQHTTAVLSQTSQATDSPPDYIRSLFDAYANRYDVHVKQALHYAVPELFKVILTSVLKDKQQLDVLDVGCGTGLCGEIVKPWSAMLIGVDLSPAMLKIANEKKIYTELVEAGTLSFLSDKEKSYDLILAGDVLVYTGDMGDTFKAVHRALKSGGLFLFNLEAGEAEPYRLATSGRFSHAQAYVDSLIKENGFEVLRAEKVILREQEGVEVIGYVYCVSS